MSAARHSDERSSPRFAAALSRAFQEPLGFVWGALTNVVTTTLAFWVAPHTQLANLVIIHLLGAVLISTRYGIVVSTFTAVTGALAFDYFCIPPIFAFALPDPHSVIIFAGMLLLALLVCSLNQGLRYQRAAARASEARTQTLCELSLSLSQLTEKEELVSRAERYLRKLFGEPTEIWLTQQSQRPQTGYELQAISDNAKLFGYIRVPQVSLFREQDERRLLLAACAERIADALKLFALGEAARRAEVDAEVERNRNALLSAVSHDMKTPLASIMTAGSSLLKSMPEAAPRELLETIVQESERMNSLITNLLSVTRLESGSAALNKEIEAIDDLVFAMLSRFSGRLASREVTVDLPRDLPMVPMDPALIDQLMVNLLENALRYSQAGTPIEISATAAAEGLAVEVRDRGPGIPATERERVFDKFYRGQAAKRNDGGTGLGLTICRAVVRAHGGRIAILARAGGGTTVRFTLPYATPLPASAMSLNRRPEA